MIKSRSEHGILSRCGALALCLFLPACGALSDFSDNINPFSKEDTLPGERQAVFDAADPAAVASARPASIGKASGGQSWTTAGGGLTNDPGNLSIRVSGSRAWRASIGSSGGSITSNDLRTFSRPVSDGSRIYVYKPNGDVVALSTGGRRVWTRSLRPEGEDDTAAGGGVTIAGGRLYVATGYGKVFALDSGSGQAVWNADLSAPARGAPVADGSNVYAVTQKNEIVALKKSDGTEVWTYAGISESAGVLSSANPAISGGRLIVPTSAGEVMAFNTRKGEPVWIDVVARGFRTMAVSGLSDVSASPVVSGGVVYATGVSGRTIASSLRNGQRLWSQDIGSLHTPVVSGGTVFMVDLDDRLVALDRKSGKVLWSTQLPKPEKKRERRNWAGPILANGVLVAVSSDGRLAMADARTGQLMNTLNVGTNVYVTPIAAGGRMIVLDGLGSVVAFN